MSIADDWASIPVAPRPASAAPAAPTDHAADWTSLSTAAPEAPRKPLQPPEKLSWFERTLSSLPDWMANDAPLRASPVGRAAMGAADMGVGAVQLAAHAIPGVDTTGMDTRIKEVEGKYQAARGPDAGTDWARIGGNVGMGLFAPMGKAAEGANFVNRLIHAGKIGGAIGLSQPVTDDAGYWGEKAKQGVMGILGGVVGQPFAEAGAKVAGTAVNAAMNFLRRFVPNGDEQVAANIVKNASPELKTAVVSAVQRGDQVNPQALTRQLEADSLPVKMSLTPGQATQDPIAISNEMNMRGKNPALVYKLQDQNQHLVDNLNAIRSSAAPEANAPDHVAAGQHLIDSIERADAVKQAAVSAKYAALKDANGGEFPVMGKTFVTNADEALGKEMKRPFLPAQVRSIMDDIKEGDPFKPMTFENFENLRTILASEARKAERAGDGNTAAAVGTVRNALEALPMSGDAEAVKPLADAARAAARDRFQHIDETKALKDVVSGSATADNFIQKHVIGANKQDLLNLSLTLKDDPIALQMIKAGAINYLKKSAGIVNDNGNFSQSGYNRALDALKPKLDVIFSPEEAAQLTTVGNVARYTQMQPRGSFVNNSNTDVANVARGAAAKAIDYLTGVPIGGTVAGEVGSALERRAASTRLGDVMATGAGATSAGPTQQLLTQTLPRAVGDRASIPLASIASQYPSDRIDNESRKRKQ